MKLAVACFPAVANLGLIFKNDNLIVFPFAEAGGGYFGALNGRAAYDGVLIIDDKQHPRQLDVFAFGNSQAGDIAFLSRGYFILLATGFDYSVSLRHFQSER